MTQKNKSIHLEPLRGKFVLSEEVSHLKDSLSRWEIKFSSSLLKEINLFIDRNTFSLGEKKLCCPRCLKAHIRKTSEQLNEFQNIKSSLDEIACEEGHEGYYMDKDVLVAL
jgi:hypothetical protein